MKFSVITLFPEMIQSFCQHGVLSQALDKKILTVDSINPRSFTADTHRTVDDRPFGGGDGMIMLAEPLEKALQSLGAKNLLQNSKGEEPHVIYLSPQGSTLNHQKILKLSHKKEIILICGRYGGIDQRLLKAFAHEEISVGDYVLSGGELAAGILIDAVSRWLPGVLGHGDSAKQDSFASNLLEHPNFTRPREYLNQKAPEVLLSGNHKLIEEWKKYVSWLTTLKKRPDLLLTLDISEKDLVKLKDFWSKMSLSEKEVLGLDTLGDKNFSLLLRT